MITNLVIFAFIYGALFGLVIAGSIVWFNHLKIPMNWWKWLLTAFWYLVFNFFIFLDFTMIGEGEIGAGWKMLLLQLVVMVVLGFALFKMLKRRAVENNEQ